MSVVAEVKHFSKMKQRLQKLIRTNELPLGLEKIDSYHCHDCAIFPVLVNMFLQVDTILPPSSNLYYACVYSKSSLFRDKGT